MNSADGTATPSQPTDLTPIVTGPADMDLKAINEAIVASANEAAQNPENTFAVEDISLDNTPTTDAELQAQKAQNPSMSLAGTPVASDASNLASPAMPTSPAAPEAALETPAPDAALAPTPKPETAGFVDGDLADDPSLPTEPEAAPDFDAIKADPVESFDENAVPATPAEAPASDPTVEKGTPAAAFEAPKKMIDFGAILHSNVAIIGIVVAIVVVLVIIVLVAVLS